jgi:hypothetical protein
LSENFASGIHQKGAVLSPSRQGELTAFPCIASGCEGKTVEYCVLALDEKTNGVMGWGVLWWDETEMGGNIFQEESGCDFLPGVALSL